jgi:hypothetical protein
MKLAKSLLLGSAAALVATAGSAADLPATKAAPVSYVKVCDAYGAGFFYIPGTETCIKVGGRVRADYAMSGKANANATNVFAPLDGSNIVGGYVYNNALTVSQTTSAYTGTYNVTVTAQSSAYSSKGVSAFGPVNGTAGGVGSASYVMGSTNGVTDASKTQYGYVAANGIDKRASNIYGWEARARVDLDARTATGYGTVQAVASLRMARTTGVLDQQGPALSATSAGPTLEAAYIRFAGFTFGAAKDNFSFMPSTFYGAGHWSSFSNGSKQLAYTAVLGGGFSATLAVQSAEDTTAGGVVVNGVDAAGILIAPTLNSAFGTTNGVPAYSYNNMPQLNGRIDLDQSWGSASLMGAVGKAVAVNNTDTYNQDKTTYAVGAGLKVNLPMIAAGDVLWLNAAYADGMTEYTTNWTSFKSSDTKRNVGGYVTNHPSWIVTPTGVETLKSWDVAAIYTHFWAPQWRQSFLGSYGAVNGTTTSKAIAWSQAGAFGDAKVWNVGTQLTFLPTKDFEIGVDVLYARVEQDIRRFGGSNDINNTLSNATITTNGYSSAVTREKAGNFTGRLRVERTF